MHRNYILAQDEHALYIIDQHAAQERVHFEEVQRRFLDQEPAMQESLVPIILEGGGAAVGCPAQEMNELWSRCISIWKTSVRTGLICRQLPAWMSEIDEQAFLQDVLDWWKDGREVRAEDLRRHRLATIACHHSDSL